MKQGLGDSYDNVQFISKKMRGYIDLTKPASSVGVGLGFFIASIFYHIYTDQTYLITDNLPGIIFASVTVLLAHSASQTMNMAEDADMDSVTEHKKNRPIPAGIVTEDEARTLAWILSVFALGRSFMVNTTFGVVMTLLIAMGIFYNLSPIRAKERIISIPWQAVSRGLFMFPAVWAAYGNVWAPEAWALGVFMFFYVLGFQNTADLIDMKVDAEYGIKTFAVVYGEKGVVKIALYSTIAMAFVLFNSINFRILPPKFIWMSAIFPFCGVMLLHMYYQPREVSKRTGNHPAWLWFYGGMVLCVTIPLLIELLA